MFKVYCFFIICLFVKVDLLAQKPLFVVKNNQKDSVGVYSSLNHVMRDLSQKQLLAFEEGFLNWSVDSLHEKTEYYLAYIYEGEKLLWESIELTIPEGLAQKSGIALENLSGSKVNLVHYVAAVEKVLSYYENHGYPFAQLQLKSLQFHSSNLNAEYEVLPGPLIKWDSLAVHGQVKIAPKYLQQFLQIQENKVFNQQSLNLIKQRVKNSPFIELSQEPMVEFSGNKALVHLYLTTKKANFFNGVVGVMPNTNVDPRLSSGNNLIITGDVQLKVFNTFNQGEKIKFNWRRLQALSQELEMEGDMNYLFGSPFGISEHFELLKQDTSFLNLDNLLGINYALNPSKVISFFWELERTNVLSENLLLNVLPGNSNAYGVKIEWENLDYPFNPRKGFYLRLSAGAGVKRLEKRGGVDDKGNILITLPSLVDELQVQRAIPVSSILYRLRGAFEYYFPIKQISTIKTAVYGAHLENPYLFDNDLNRIGGFKTLRGFDERSIFNSSFVLTTLEYRLLLERNSYIQLFYDQAFVIKNTVYENTSDTPMGFGAGINFESGNGVFSISYAIGRQLGNPIEFRSAKIHFGFVSLF